MSGADELTVKLNAEARRSLERLSKLARIRSAPILEVLGAKMLEQSRARLESGKGPDGDVWEPWSPAYAASGKGRKPLEKTGNLLSSLVAEQSSDAVSLGSNVLYAAVHLHGSDAQGIPARPYLGFSDDDLDELGQMTLEYLVRETK